MFFTLSKEGELKLTQLTPGCKWMADPEAHRATLPNSQAFARDVGFRLSLPSSTLWLRRMDDKVTAFPRP